ncbi:PREDICTED: acylphosphatase-1 isoform X2 [Gavialis gangeticus]|uniref:acylphosphatase-1 isoform X2 n=1 Tax=Gavialis gangeticus TaxID=94835 RepID=UPI00092F49C0|nr:PREDICTED: acylphosphatase-1 isoform X2 [Gavialis gangeticus]
MASAGSGRGWLLTLCAVLVCQAGAAMDNLVSVDYEVFGKAEGRQLGLVGWVRNTERGTVQGQVQGPAAAVRQLQQWLRDTGSPKSRIDRAEFRNEKKVATLQYEDFLIRK